MLLVTDVERRNPGFRKFKIIRAINAAFFRPRIGNGDASLSSCHPREGIVHSRHAAPGLLDLARLTPHVPAAAAHISQRFLARVKSLPAIILCPPYAPLLSPPS